jgi:GT2 family glycosyltransferase
MNDERANQAHSEQAQREAETIIGNQTPRGQLADLPRRIRLTYSYHGPRAVVLRGLTFPLRFTPFAGLVMHNRQARARRSAARAWYRRNGKPVTVVIPSYRDAKHVARLVRSIRRTTPRRGVRIIVCDDASGPEHAAALTRIRGIEVVAGERNSGFAANVNRGIRASDPSHDVVVLNSDTLARRGWLAALQRCSFREERAGVVGAKLLYPDGRIQFAGTIRNPSAPEWFDHRFRFKPPDWGPANVLQPALAVTGACMYIKREVIDQVGLLDEAYPMAYEDVDYCLRAWQAGWRVLVCPDAELVHFESTTRGTEVRERERVSQQVFWRRWGDLFDAPNARRPDGSLRVVYVTQDCGVGGGHRVVFEQLDRLRERGHDAQLWTLKGPPDWFELQSPVRIFEDYDELAQALASVPAIKVATWWETAEPVFEAGILEGIPVYFVQDIETSYYRDGEASRHRVLASYDPGYRYLTTSRWNAERLGELGVEATIISPGIDLGVFRPRPDVERRRDMVLALGRSNPLKNLPLTLEAWRALPHPRPELCLFGVEPELAPKEPGIRYVTAPSDEEVNTLFNQATVFLQTSDHEGFCLPVLEAMAAGCPVVCTDAHGNRDYCEDGRNCLMPRADVQPVTAAISRLMTEVELRERLTRGGITTAGRYGWSERIDALEQFLLGLTIPRRIRPSTNAVPELRRAPVK